MFERRHQALISHKHFVTRMTRHAMGTVALIVVTLCLGMAGYHWTEGLPWVDAYLNASMILSGMGEVTELHTWEGKVFAGTYALFAGLVFVVAIGVVLAPALHRAMHRFHLDEDEPGGKTGAAKKARSPKKAE